MKTACFCILLLANSLLASDQEVEESSVHTVKVNIPPGAAVVDILTKDIEAITGSSVLRTTGFLRSSKPHRRSYPIPAISTGSVIRFTLAPDNLWIERGYDEFNVIVSVSSAETYSLGFYVVKNTEKNQAAIVGLRLKKQFSDCYLISAFLMDNHCLHLYYGHGRYYLEATRGPAIDINQQIYFMSAGVEVKQNPIFHNYLHNHHVFDH